MGYRIVLLLYFMFFLYPGCYNVHSVTGAEDIRNLFQERMGIYQIDTGDSVCYSFKDHRFDYIFENDTLVARAKKITSDPWRKFEKIKIPLDHITVVKMEEIDELRSGIFFVSTGIIVYFIIDSMMSGGMNLDIVP